MTDTLLKSLSLRGIPVVESCGPEVCDLMILGEALGEAETTFKTPFADPWGAKLPWPYFTAGGMLNQCLKGAGVDRTKVHLTNVVPIRPRDNNLKNLAELGLSIKDFYPSLKERIERVKPKVILALGTTASEAVADVSVGGSDEETKISTYRGSILPCSLVVGPKVVTSFHPSFIMRQNDTTAKRELAGEGKIKYNYGSSKVCLILDIKRAKEETSNNLVPLDFSSFQIQTDPETSVALNLLDQVMLTPFPSFDIETKPPSYLEISRIAFSTSPISAVTLSESAEVEVHQKIAQVMREHKGLVAQNGTFDITLLMPFAPIGQLHFDTMLAHHFLYSELPHSLAFLTSIYTRIPFNMGIHSIEQKLYNPIHAIETHQVADALKAELDSLGMSKTFFGYIMPLFHSIVRMGWRGVLMDQLGTFELRKELDTKIEEMSKQLEDKIGKRINVKSSDQVCDYLYDVLKLPEQKKKVKGKVNLSRTVDATALEKLYFKTKNPILRQILDIREKRTLNENFARKKIDQDGRWRTTYSVSGTDTGRLSGKKTVFKTGSSLMNIPRPPDPGEEDKEGTFIRRTMRASKGKILIEADKSQAEARLTAWFSQDIGMKNIFKSGKDIHKWNASIIFKKPMDQIAKDERYFAKRVVHGFDYGLGVDHLRDMILRDFGEDKPRKFVEEIRSTYFAGCPSILRWHEEIQQTVLRTQILVNPFGRRRYFFGRPGEDLFRKAYAQLPQSTCVDDINSSIPRIEVRLPDGADLLMQVHDSVVLECWPDLKEECVKVLREEMANTILIHNDPLIIPIEIKWGENWGEMSEIK